MPALEEGQPFDELRESEEASAALTSTSAPEEGQPFDKLRESEKASSHSRRLPELVEGLSFFLDGAIKEGRLFDELTDTERFDTP